MVEVDLLYLSLSAFLNVYHTEPNVVVQIDSTASESSAEQFMLTGFCSDLEAKKCACNELGLSFFPALAENGFFLFGSEVVPDASSSPLLWSSLSLGTGEVRAHYWRHSLFIPSIFPFHCYQTVE